MGTFVRIELVCHTLLMNFICLALRPNLHSIPLVRSRWPGLRRITDLGSLIQGILNRSMAIGKPIIFVSVYVNYSYPYSV